MENFFRNNIKITITSNGKIIDEKCQNDIKKEAAKTSALLSGKIDKYEYLTGEEILQSDQFRRIKQATFTYSPLGKTLEKQTKNDWRPQRKTKRKQLETDSKSKCSTQMKSQSLLCFQKDF